MTEKNVCTIALEDYDLDFMANVVSPTLSNREAIKKAIREDHAFRTNVTGSDLVFERIIDKKRLVIISPILLFEVFLRRAAKEMEESAYTIERGISQKIPVFDTKETLGFLDEDGVFDYLVKLLVSFIACEKQTVNDIDIKNLVKLVDGTPANQRFELYKRIADSCLFTLGILPEYVMYDYYWLFYQKKFPTREQLTQTLGDYEIVGQKFYELASKEEKAAINNLDRTLGLFSQKFNLAKKPLNYVSGHFIPLTRK